MKINSNRLIKKLKRILRIVILVFLILLACMGIGLTGAAPLSFGKRQVLPEEAHVEMIDKEEKDEEKEQEDVISG